MLALIFQSVTDTSGAAKKIAENAEKFTEIDPLGIGITAIGITVVFLSLLLLYILFLNITRLVNMKLRKNLFKAGKIEEAGKKELGVSGEINAAISMALHMYFSELHDRESAILTINKVARSYSPWSSKIYGLRQYPHIIRKNPK